MFEKYTKEEEREKKKQREEKENSYLTIHRQYCE